MPLHFKKSVLSVALPLCLSVSLMTSNSALGEIAPLPLNTPPPITLALKAPNTFNVKDYWISEKLDGIRAYWNGHQLLSRQGHLIHAPTWFTHDFPNTPLDGELWIGRKQFEPLMSIVSKDTPDETEWKSVKFMAYDLPSDLQPFSLRNHRLAQVIKEADLPHLQHVEQYRVATTTQLEKNLTHIIKHGGEGLMLREGNSVYVSGRHASLLKLKRHDDNEAIVVAHIPGKGKFKGMMGSIRVKTKEGVEFKIGSGFTDVERKNPPKIGSQITYKYYGKTRTGKPKFASFLRIRETF